MCVLKPENSVRGEGRWTILRRAHFGPYVEPIPRLYDRIFGGASRGAPQMDGQRSALIGVENCEPRAEFTLAED